MSLLLIVIGGIGFLVSIIAHLYVKLHLRPKGESDIDDYYYEFEHTHPELVRYEKWSRITFSAVVISVLLVFAAFLF